MTNTFQAIIEIIGVNPYVEVPSSVLSSLQNASQKMTSPIPVKGTLNGKPYIQTVVKYQGLWRLYLNTPMREETQTTVGDRVTVTVEFDPVLREVPIPPVFQAALHKSKKAQEAFDRLPAYRRKELSRYIGNLKSEGKIQENVKRTIEYLEGKKVKGVLYR